MGRRRMLLLIAVLLATTAIVAALTPVPREEGEDEPERPPPATSERPDAGDSPRGSVRLRFDAATPATRTVPAGSHVILEVSVPEPAEVDIPELGRIGNATPGTPAVFDILAEETGRFELRFTPGGADPRPAGTLVVEPSG